MMFSIKCVAVDVAAMLKEYGDSILAYYWLDEAERAKPNPRNRMGTKTERVMTVVGQTHTDPNDTKYTVEDLKVTFKEETVDEGGCVKTTSVILVLEMLRLTERYCFKELDKLLGNSLRCHCNTPLKVNDGYAWCPKCNPPQVEMSDTVELDPRRVYCPSCKVLLSDPQEGIRTCPLCSGKFEGTDVVRIRPPRPEDVPAFARSCPSCNSQDFAKRQMRDMGYVCLVCNARVDQKGKLIGEVEMATSIKLLSCRICHAVTEKGEEGNRCSHCAVSLDLEGYPVGVACNSCESGIFKRKEGVLRFVCDECEQWLAWEDLKPVINSQLVTGTFKRPQA